MTLRSDSRKNLLMPLYDLGCVGRSCIVPKSELLDLIIPLDSEAQSLDLFWGTVVGEFYDPILAIDMFRVMLFGPWRTFNVPEAVVKLVDENMDIGKVSEVQLWGCNLRTPSPSSNDSSDCTYIPGQTSSQLSDDIDKLDNLELTPNSKKWFINSSNPSNELGLDCNMSFTEFSNLPVNEHFAPGMWNSPCNDIPPPPQFG